MLERTDMPELRLLREELCRELSPYRFAHTLGVERMTARLCALYCPEQSGALAAAALLHDLTKEWSEAQQLDCFTRHGVVLRPDEQASPKIWHGISAALLIPERYPALAQQEILSAVRWHTTGHAEMTLTEAILFLADYIEEGRSFPPCVETRERFFAGAPEKLSPAARRVLLAETVRDVLQKTLLSLEERGAPISLDTKAALEWIRQAPAPFEK